MPRELGKYNHPWANGYPVKESAEQMAERLAAVRSRTGQLQERFGPADWTPDPAAVPVPLAVELAPPPPPPPAPLIADEALRSLARMRAALDESRHRQFPGTPPTPPPPAAPPTPIVRWKPARRTFTAMSDDVWSGFEKVPAAARAVDQLDSVMAPMPFDAELYRHFSPLALPPELREAAAPDFIGLTLEEPGYLSVSADPAVYDHKTVRMVLEVPTGHPHLVPLKRAALAHEREVILGRGTRMVVIAAEVSPAGQLVLRARVS